VACSCAFDVMVNLLVRQNAGFRTSIPPMRLKSKAVIRSLSRSPLRQNPQNSVDFLRIIP
jgi:hypothetical protein